MLKKKNISTNVEKYKINQAWNVDSLTNNLVDDKKIDFIKHIN